MPARLTIDMWSDIACPWCYIGKRRLEAALAAFGESDDAPDVTVAFHSFQLIPDTPDDYLGSAAEFLAAHLGVTLARARRMHEHVASVAAEVGLTYDFDRQRPANTLAAHQVLQLAKARGVQSEVTERLFRAHFVEGRHVGRTDELAMLAGEAGLDPDEVLRALREQTHLPAVRADQRRARELGIGGVPYIVVDDRYSISGAQPAEAFAQVLAQARADRGEGSAA